MTQQLARTDDGYREAQDAVRDCVCGTCGGELVCRWNGAANHYDAACPRDGAGIAFKLRRESERDQVRERLERTPALASQMVPVREVPLTTQAIRELDNAKLLARVPERYGTTITVSPQMRVQLAQLARIYGLDPLWDLMVYEGQPYVTYDGRLRKLREHPDYRGHKVRPLNKAEKEEWDYAPGDLVIQCDVDMGARGIITDWGIVRESEVTAALERAKRDGKRSAPVGVHRQQIAIKRAVGRASKQAVGIDLPTVIEAASGRVIDVQEVRQAHPPLAGESEAQARRRFWATARADAPEGLALNDEDVHRLLGVESLKDYPGGWDQALSDLTERAAQDLAEQLGEHGWPSDSEDDAEEIEQVVHDEPASAPIEMVNSVRDPAYQELADLLEKMQAQELDTSELQLRLPRGGVPLDDVRGRIARARQALGTAAGSQQVAF